jgi:CHASE2 domain-containing sensor protein
MKPILSPEQRFLLKQLRLKWLAPVFQLLSAITLALLSVIFLYSSFGMQLELFILRQFYQIRGIREAPKEVFIVSVDDKSYKDLKASTNYPLPRKHIATAFEAINQAAPKVIIIDAKIPEERHIDPDADARIEAALRAGPTTIWNGSIPDATDLSPENLSLPSEDRFRKAAKMELPMTLASAKGIVTFMTTDNRPTAKLYDAVQLARPLIELANYKIEAPDKGSLINFYGPRDSLNRISLSDLVLDKTNQISAKLKDKIVLVGYQSLHYGKGRMGKDEFFVPVSSEGMFGVEIHANVVGNLLDKSWLRRFDLATEMTLIFIVIFIMASYAMRLPTLKTLASILTAIVLIFVSAYIGFSNYNFHLHGLGSLSLAGLIIVICSVAYFFRRTENYRSYIDRTFSFEKEQEL